MSNEQWSEWIKNAAGMCPVAPGTHIEYKMARHGIAVSKNPERLRWSITGNRWSDIIAYRYRLGDSAMNEEEQEIPAEDWNGYVDADDDMVNHPPHYQLRNGYEVYDLSQDLARKAQAANVPHDQYSDWDRALEYLLRMWDKNGVEDAKKGAWYISKLIGKLEASEVRAREIDQ